MSTIVLLEYLHLGHRAALLPAWMYEAWEKLAK